MFEPSVDDIDDEIGQGLKAAVLVVGVVVCQEDLGSRVHAAHHVREPHVEVIHVGELLREVVFAVLAGRQGIGCGIVGGRNERLYGNLPGTKRARVG